MSEKRIGLIPCQGTSNVGMITNKVAVNVTDNEKVNMVCPLGLPLGIKSMVDKVNGYDHHIALNGCSMRWPFTRCTVCPAAMYTISTWSWLCSGKAIKRVCGRSVMSLPTASSREALTSEPRPFI